MFFSKPVIYHSCLSESENSLFLCTGMFESINGTEHAINAGNSQSDRNDRKPMKQDRKDIPSGVVGISVNKQGSMDDPNMDILDDVEEVSLGL